MKLDKMKRNAIVLFGGKSVEHDISIITGVQIMHALDEKRFNVIPIYIKDNKWIFNENFKDISVFANQSKIAGTQVTLSVTDGCLYKVCRSKQKLFLRIDFVFSSLHGGCGENGSISGLLNVAHIPYAFSDVVGCSASMNKLVTKLCCTATNIPIPNYAALNEQDKKLGFKIMNNKLSKLKFPLIVKPNSLGSSIGITYCKTKKQLENAIFFAFMFDNVVLVEEVVQNLRELNMSLMGNSMHVEFSKIEEVTTSKDFLSFESKYLNAPTSNNKGMESMDREICVDINESVVERMKEYGKLLFEHLSLSGCVRIDYLYDSKSDVLYVNEINSIPGSMANYLWKDKYSFKTLLNKVYDYGVEEFELKDKKTKSFSTSVLSQFSGASKIYLNKNKQSWKILTNNFD